MNRFVCNCGRIWFAKDERTARCVRCGGTAEQQPEDALRVSSAVASGRYVMCKSCSHFGPHQREGQWFDGCGLLSKPCTIDRKRLDPQFTGPPGKRCWPRMNPVRKRVASVGFLAVAYMPIGGTETWHRTLIPSIRGAGFVCLNEELAKGPIKNLPCWTGVGERAARQLAADVDVLVVWGVGDRLGSILPKNRPRVISVSHCDRNSIWTRQMMSGQSSWTDVAVHICPSGIETVPESLRPGARLIPNGIDPERCRASRSRELVRQELGVRDGQKMLLSVTRLSPEKRIPLLVEAAKRLSDEYRLVVAGSSGGWSSSHLRELEEMQFDRFRLIPSVDSPGDLFAAADAYISLSEYEGFGLSIGEAALAGVPIIATSVGIAEMAPKISATTDLAADANEVAAAILTDFGDRLAQSTRALAATAIIKQRFSKERFVTDWRNLIDSLRKK